MDNTTGEMEHCARRSQRQTDLHGRLAVRLLEVSIIYIYGYTELPLFTKSDFAIGKGKRGR